MLDQTNALRPLWELYETLLLCWKLPNTDCRTGVTHPKWGHVSDHPNTPPPTPHVPVWLKLKPLHNYHCHHRAKTKLRCAFTMKYWDYASACNLVNNSSPLWHFWDTLGNNETQSSALECSLYISLILYVTKHVDRSYMQITVLLWMCSKSAFCSHICKQIW